MTTLIGIKTKESKNPHAESVVLASDMNTTTSSWKASGDIAVRQQTKSESQKIYVNDSRDVALCMTGVYDRAYIHFLTQVLRGEIDVKNAVDKGYFPELLALNESRWDHTVPDLEKICGLLIATRFDRPRLFNCQPLGKVIEKDYDAAGSGSKFAGEYIIHQGKLIPDYLSLEEGIEVAVGALDEASQDIYTGGLDLVVVNRNGIYTYGKQVNDAMKNAKRRELGRVKRDSVRRLEAEN